MQQHNRVTDPALLEQLNAGGDPIKKRAPKEGPTFIPGMPGWVVGPDGVPRQIASPPEKPAKPNLPAGYMWDERTGRAVRVPGLPTTDNVSAPRLTAKERADALAGYKNASALERIASDIEAKFKAGPGATKGLMGLADYLPTGANKAFDDTGNQARGYIKQGLGFTGGEGNTAAESQINYGPYIPAAGDRDAQILNKIAALRQLASDSRAKAVSILGGQPDANGNVTPVEQAVPPSPTDLPPPADTGAPQGDTRRIPDQEVQDQVSAFIRAGVPYEAANEYVIGKGKNPIDPRQYASAVQFAQSHPGLSGGLARAYSDVPLTETQKLLDPIARSAGGTLAGTFANSATAGIPTLLAGPEANQALATMRANNPGAALTGDVGGAVAGMVGGQAALRGMGGVLARAADAGGGILSDMGYGALYGASENPNDRLSGAGRGLIAAGAGNLAGRGLAAGTSKAMTGVKNDAVRRLSADGTTLTLGQTLGNRGPLGRLLNVMESAPIVQGLSANVRNQGWKDINRQAFRDALEPFGAQASGQVGEAGVSQAHDQVSQLYDNAFSGKLLTGDRALRDELEAISSRVQSLPEPLRDNFNAMVNLRVRPMFDGLQLDGKGLQAAMKGIRMDAGSILRRSEPMADLYNTNAQDLIGSLEGLAERQFPGTVGQVRAANTANRHVSVLDDAILSAANQGGIPTAAQINRAAINNTKKFGGKRAAAEGNVPFKALTDRATEVMGSTHPDSGTATRVLAPFVPYALGGAAGGSDYLNLPTPVTATLATLAALSTKPGARAFQSLATKRPDKVIDMGEYLYGARRSAGLLGGGLLLPAVNQ